MSSRAKRAEINHIGLWRVSNVSGEAPINVKPFFGAPDTTMMNHWSPMHERPANAATASPPFEDSCSSACSRTQASP